MKQKPVIVVGGGHAGIEAAYAISRLGIKACLVTMDLAAIGRMSCNPAIGGLGKGHLVREIDALGGVMGFAADKCGIQFKMLNTSKGRAVWSPRAQIDKLRYSDFILDFISRQKNIEIIQDEVVDFSVDNLSLSGVFLRRSGHLSAGGLVICSGTFMNGLIHVGSEKYSAGRLGERASSGLTKSLLDHNFHISRLKTGTPPRLLAGSICWDRLQMSSGDKAPVPFSILTKKPFCPENIPCHVVDTNPAVHKILKDNLFESAMYSGKINGVGPRYCPSIEDKMVRFGEKKHHQLFLEPEWRNSEQIYVGGFSTSMSRHIQERSIRKIIGLEQAEFIRHGYAIEYDYFPTYQLKRTLETKKISGLYFAGQLNGTSGYEEAAAQGLVSGANAALKLLNKEPFLLDRNEAYIGVLIDDLITKNINEPYRMFTSRAERRLFLRPDNSERRLTEKGFMCGLVNKKQYDIFKDHENAVNKIKSRFRNIKIFIDGRVLTLEAFLKRPDANIYAKEIPKSALNGFPGDALFSAETDVKYDGYVRIEARRLEKIKRMENIRIPDGFDYGALNSVSAESKEKLMFVLPETLGQASRIAGVRPSDVSVLAMYLSVSS